jgi:hypothetical protein
VIYKVKTKTTVPVDQAREEIKATLRSQRLQDEMGSIQDSASPTLDESYFRPSRLSQGMMRAGESARPASKRYPTKADQ